MSEDLEAARKKVEDCQKRLDDILAQTGDDTLVDGLCSAKRALEENKAKGTGD
jgi:hypothetical protein